MEIVDGNLESLSWSRWTKLIILIKAEYFTSKKIPSVLLGEVGEASDEI